jgi:hypothetical protein
VRFAFTTRAPIDVDVNLYFDPGRATALKNEGCDFLTVRVASVYLYRDVAGPSQQQMLQYALHPQARHQLHPLRYCIAGINRENPFFSMIGRVCDTPQFITLCVIYPFVFINMCALFDDDQVTDPDAVNVAELRRDLQEMRVQYEARVAGLEAQVAQLQRRLEQKDEAITELRDQIDTLQTRHE